MADWIDNELWIIGEASQLRVFKERADERFLPLSERDPYNGVTSPSVLSFHRLFPMPADVIARGYDPPGGGYDWQKENWGIKWGAHDAVLHDASLQDFGDCLVYAFETAWEPPSVFFQKVSSFYPYLIFDLKPNYPDNDWLEEVTFQAGVELEEF